MFEDLYIPWTSRYHRRTETPETPTPKPNEVCATTLHIARAIIADAVAPFPEVARAIGAAFSAYICGQLTLNCTGDPTTWTVLRRPGAS
jgi:hypothetical protein